jgi:nicotinamide-nucleotide amidase
MDYRGRMNAEIIAIGTELLLGEIVDTNSAHIARKVRDIGLDLFFLTTVGDNEERAAAAIGAALDRADVVITTGGLGPTVDDVTRQAVARAAGRPLEIRPDLLEQIAARFKRWGTKMSANNRQQAFVPAGALALENPVGTAPCFIVETERGAVISLPGVPREMVYMLEHAVIPYLQEKMGAPAIIVARVLRTAGIGESQVDTLIRDLERLSNPTVGLAAHAGQTDIRVTAKAASLRDAEALIEPIVHDIRGRLGINIYGEGVETVEEVLLSLLSEKGLTLSTAEAGTGGVVTERLMAVIGSRKVLGHTVGRGGWGELAAELGLPTALEDENSLVDRANAVAGRIRAISGTTVALGVLVQQDEEGQPVVAFSLVTPNDVQGQARGYGGPPEYVAIWASTWAFDRLRRWLLREA